METIMKKEVYNIEGNEFVPITIGRSETNNEYVLPSERPVQEKMTVLIRKDKRREFDNWWRDDVEKEAEKMADDKFKAKVFSAAKKLTQL